MTRLESLKSLEAKMDAGITYVTMGDTRLCQLAFPSQHPDTSEGYANAPAQLAINVWNRGSLDAAKALHDAVLSGWYVAFITQTNIQWRVRLQERGGNSSSAKAENPARAWLIAILRALIAIEESE